MIAGASGAVLGTRFVATRESLAHVDYKQAILAAQAKDTAMSVCFQGGWPGATHRHLRNRTFVQWEAAGCPPEGKRPGEGDVLATHPDGRAVVRYNSYTLGSALKGNILELVLYAGEGVGAIRDLPGAGELVRRLWAECLLT